MTPIDLALPYLFTSSVCLQTCWCQLSRMSDSREACQRKSYRPCIQIHVIKLHFLKLVLIALACREYYVVMNSYLFLHTTLLYFNVKFLSRSHTPSQHQRHVFPRLLHFCGSGSGSSMRDLRLGGLYQGMPLESNRTKMWSAWSSIGL